MMCERMIPKSLQFVCMLLVTLFITATGYASNGKIVGHIVDKSTGDPLPGVNVVVNNTNMGAATDAEGDYYILNVPPGCYEVTASMIGYQQITKTDVNVNINHTTQIDFSMSETVLEYEDAVTVIAERPLIEVDKTSSRVIVESAEIASRPVSQMSDLMTSIPGIDYNPSGELTVRMGTLDQVAFMIDGMRARNPLNSQPYFNINLMAIEELEIITGGFDAEYGEAQSGVFNIITRGGPEYYTGTVEFRWIPPGKPHWGTALYDYSTDRYWENTHARHQQWWIDNPNMWVDPEGRYGTNPECTWTPEEAYQHYIATHQPLTDYTEQSGYQVEFALGGPTFTDKLRFFVSGRYRTEPPITGNAYRKMGEWIDGTYKLSYHLKGNKMLVLSGYYNQDFTCHGMEYLDFVGEYGNKYAYYDYAGYTESRRNGQTLKFVHNLRRDTYYELHLSRVSSYESQTEFPSDTSDWTSADIQRDYLRATDEEGIAIPNAWDEIVGMHYIGYWYRKEDFNTDFTFSGKLVSQLNKKWQMRSGFGLTYYHMDRYQEARAWEAVEDKVYNPFEGNVWWSNKLEFEGLIMNLGLRYDFYNPNDKIYLNPFDPLDVLTAEAEGREPDPETKPTYTFGQLSPRIGISHPITEKSVMHFNYGHFFQRAPFGEYGEGGSTYSILTTYLISPEFGEKEPRSLGNRELKPRKTVAYELGIEQDLGPVLVDVTAYYKDRTNDIRTVSVVMYNEQDYKTSGNSDYADAKGVEFSLRRPLRGFWGGYLTYTWETGINGYSGDPYIIYPDEVTIQVSQEYSVGDYLSYMRPNLSANFTIVTPPDFSYLGGLLSNIQFSIDYYVSFPHKQISSDVFQDAVNIVRPANKNANIRIRKGLNLFKGVGASLFVEMENAFNDKWHNVDIMEGDLKAEDRARYINSNLKTYAETLKNGAPFKDLYKYNNLPRKIIFGMAVNFNTKNGR
ncbi:MAG: hypothetical protein DRP86_02980 [Candidatus Neomarinimicrobiota bacterium]|nr:MAG: hypothetical protein DRP86_02980 [Candidatus Neomarinimicrobiota bacterium]